MLLFFSLIVINDVYLKATNSDSYLIQSSYVCPKHFNPIGRKCYFFSQDKSTWQDAHFNCQFLNSSLAVITKSHQETLLRHYLNNKVLTRQERWIGGKFNYKTSKWIWGASGQPLKFQAFSRMDLIKPSDWHCIIIDPAHHNKWSSRNCLQKKNYVCQTDTNAFVEFKLKYKKNFNISKCADFHLLNEFEKRKCIKLLDSGVENSSHNEPAFLKRKTKVKKPKKQYTQMYMCPENMFQLGNKCYTFSTEEASFREAHNNCDKKKTKLAIVKSQNQDRALRIFLNGLYVEHHERWLGGVYDWKAASWKWAVTGQPLKYRGFGKNVLANRTLSWTGIIMDPVLKNQWNIRLLSDRKHYICQVKAKTIVNYGGTHPAASITITA